MSDYRNIRTGVIGVGSMGQNHARIYSEISNLIGVSDPNEKQGRQVAERFGVKWYEDYHELISLVDSVSISAPTVHHFEIAKSFTKAGKNVLVEKPFTATKEEADILRKLSSRFNTIIAVGHIERHNPIVKYIKDYLSDNPNEELISLHSERLSSYPERISDVGIIFDLSVHDIDIYNYIFGNYPISIYATGGSYMDGKREDHVSLVLEYGENRYGICNTSWLSPSKVRQLKVKTSGNIINVDYIKQSAKFTKSKFLKLDSGNLFHTSEEQDMKEILLAKQEPLKNEIIDFLESTVSKSEPLVTSLDGLKIIEIAEHAIDSLKSGEKIIFDIC